MSVILVEFSGIASIEGTELVEISSTRVVICVLKTRNPGWKFCNLLVALAANETQHSRLKVLDYRTAVKSNSR